MGYLNSELKSALKSELMNNHSLGQCYQLKLSIGKNKVDKIINGSFSFSFRIRKKQDRVDNLIVVLMPELGIVSLDILASWS